MVLIKYKLFKVINGKKECLCYDEIVGLHLLFVLKYVFTFTQIVLDMIYFYFMKSKPEIK